MSKSIKVIKESEGHWLVWNKENGKVANVITIRDGGVLGERKTI